MIHLESRKAKRLVGRRPGGRERLSEDEELRAAAGRAAGDILQNILDGCYWKCGLFLGFEGPALFMLYTQAM